MIEKVLKVYGIDPQTSQVESLTSGLINNTWKVTTDGKEFIVQRINHQVFRKPFDAGALLAAVGHALHLGEQGGQP